MESEILARHPRALEGLEERQEEVRKSWHLSPSPADPCYMQVPPGEQKPELEEEPTYVKIDDECDVEKVKTGVILPAFLAQKWQPGIVAPST